MKKMEIRESVNSFSPSDLDGRTISTPDDAWKIFIGLAEKKYKSFYIDYDYDYNEHSGGTFAVYGIRDETAEEYEERADKEKQFRRLEKLRKEEERTKKEMIELAEYERLKKKLGK